MLCKDIEENLAVYADYSLSESEGEQIRLHLAACPLCRLKLSQYQSISLALGESSRFTAPDLLVDSVRTQVSNEIRRRRSYRPAFSAAFSEWMQMKLMPYTVGTFASVLLLLLLLNSLLFTRRGVEQVRELQADNRSIFIESPPAAFDSETISPSDYAALRTPVSGESPSLNPSGALVALTRSLISGSMNEDEVVLVADVFGDGMARVAKVVEAPKTKRSLKDLEKALHDDPAYAPFLPAKLDQRPDVVRVVLKIQKVEVRDTAKPRLKLPRRAIAD